MNKWINKAPGEHLYAQKSERAGSQASISARGMLPSSGSDAKLQGQRCIFRLTLFRSQFLYIRCSEYTSKKVFFLSSIQTFNYKIKYKYIT